MFLCAFITAFHTFRRHRLCVVLLYFCCCCWFRLGFSLQRILLIVWQIPNFCGSFFLFFCLFVNAERSANVCVSVCACVWGDVFSGAADAITKNRNFLFAGNKNFFESFCFLFLFHRDVFNENAHVLFVVVCFSVMIRFEIGTGISLHVVCIKYGKKFDKNVKTYAWPHSFLFWCTIFDEFLLYRKCSTPIINISWGSFRVDPSAIFISSPAAHNYIDFSGRFIFI